jgi:hypothetical protein
MAPATLLPEPTFEIKLIEKTAKEQYNVRSTNPSSLN